MATHRRSRADVPITLLLRKWMDGEVEAANELVEALFPEMRRIAARLLRRESPAHTLQPTALVNDAYLKLIEQDRTDWKGRSPFLAVTAQLMRRILVDRAR